MSETYYETNCNQTDMTKEKVYRTEKFKMRDLVSKYLDETTVHGVRYIGKRDSIICLRLLWLFVFLVCAGLMGFQIIDRILYYGDWPVTVDVRINYIDKLPFPALTICNQNAFKTSATASNGQYDLLEDVFSGNVSKLDNYPEWRNITLQQLNLDDGHRKEDMIIQCKWAGRKCNTSWFNTIVTDHGLCFTFNGPDVLTASASGAKAGLKLLLNIEQYEYMPGPHDAAGLKVLLHEPNEFPFIGELGKAVQAGTHTFIGVQMLKLHHLGRPHGNCGDVKLNYMDDYIHTLSTCRADCRAQILLDNCGCLDFYFPLKKGYRSCTIEDVPCVFKANDALKTVSDSKCHCPVMCDSNHFESDISFASISNLAVQKMMRKTDLTKVGLHFVRAREISQRMWKHVIRDFGKTINNLNHQFLIYNATLDDKLRVAVVQSYKNLKNVYRNTKTHWSKKRYYYRFQDYVLRKNILRGRDAFEERYFMYVAINPYGFNAYVKDVFSSLAAASKNQTRTCLDREALVNIRAAIVSRLDVAKEGHTHMKTLIDSFDNGTPIFEYRFGSLSRDIGRSIIPKKLMKFALRRSWSARNYGLNTAKSIKDIINILEKYLNFTDNICEGQLINTSYVEQLNNNFATKCLTFYHNKANLYTETLEWAHKELNLRIARFEEKWNKFETNFNEMEVNFLSYLGTLQDVNDSLSMVKESIDFAQNYIINSNITKMDLYKKFHSPKSNAFPGKINSFKSETNTRSTSTIDRWKTMSETTQGIWKIIIDDADMKEFYEYTNKSDYLVNSTAFLGDIKRNFSKYVKESEFGQLISGTDDEFLNAYKQTVDHLVHFANSLKIENNFIRENFLKLEVFYKELSYEEIRQQPAYDIFALLCDIGGSMGLFVGASVMSVFEIIDLLCHILLTRDILSGRRRSNKKTEYNC